MNTNQELKPVTQQGLRPFNQNARSATYLPATNIIETPEQYILDVEMPGVDDQHAEVTLESDVLTIKGDINSRWDDAYQPVLREYNEGNYKRVFSLSAGVERDRIQATMKDGVLHLVLPKAEQEKPHKISVRAQ